MQDPIEKYNSPLSLNIASAGGKILIITAELEEHLVVTFKAVGDQVKLIIDSKNILVKYFKERDLIDVAISEKKGYEHGMAQPVILVICWDGKNLEKWAIIPSAIGIECLLLIFL
jgi:hypothetical protein